jgi:hypothetical protein
MSHVEDLVDQVMLAFNSRRRRGWNVSRQPLAVSDSELKLWHRLVEERLKAFSNSTGNRNTLLKRARHRFKNQEWTADFAGVADELQQMARKDLRDYLSDNGVTENSAHQIAEGYSIGALLQ